MIKTLLVLVFMSVSLFGADLPAPVPPTDDPPGEALNWLNLLISGLTPMVVLGIRKLVPKIPKLVLPLAAPIIGMCLDWVLRLASVETGGWMTGLVYGAVGNWLYEAQKEVRLAGIDGPAPAGPKGAVALAKEEAKDK